MVPHLHTLVAVAHNIVYAVAVAVAAALALVVVDSDSRLCSYYAVDNSQASAVEHRHRSFDSLPALIAVVDLDNISSAYYSVQHSAAYCLVRHYSSNYFADYLAKIDEVRDVVPI